MRRATSTASLSGTPAAPWGVGIRPRRRRHKPRRLMRGDSMAGASNEGATSSRSASNSVPKASAPDAAVGRCWWVEVVGGRRTRSGWEGYIGGISFRDLKKNINRSSGQINSKCVGASGIGLGLAFRRRSSPRCGLAEGAERRLDVFEQRRLQQADHKLRTEITSFERLHCLREVAASEA